MLARRLGPVEVRFTRKAGDATVLAAELASAGFDPVIAAGGDLTLNEVVNGRLATRCEVRVGVLPIASGGDFARTLELGGSSGAVETLAAGYCRKVDVVRTRFQGPDGAVERHFISVASIGVGWAGHAGRAGRMAFPPRGLRYLAACIPKLAAGCVFNVRLFLDGVETGTLDVTIVSLAMGDTREAAS